MSAMANTTPLVTIVTKPATNPRDADATPRVNIQDFCEEYYEDILPIIMDKVRCDKRKEVHAMLDFEEGYRERRTREDSHHSSVRARTTKLERLKVRDRLRYGDRHILDRLGHRRQSAFDRLTKTYSPSTTKSRPRGTDFRDHLRGRSRPHRLDTSNEDCPEDRERFRGFEESYDDSYSHSYRDGNRSRHIKRRRDNESPLFSVSKSDSSDGRVWFDELPPESVDSYKDLKATFLAYFMQQNKYVKDPVEIHNIKQKDGETIEDFIERFKVETGRMNGAPECMRISGFMHEPPPPMVRPVEKRSSNKFYDFHNDKGHSTDECMQLKKQIEKLVQACKLSHLIKKIKHGRDQSKKETPAKDKPTAIYMIQSWQRMTRQKVTQSFKWVREITFPPLTASSGVEGPLVIEAEIGGYMIHHMYVDGGSSIEILYEHCFNRLWPEIKNQMVPATSSLTGFSGETIWPLGQLRLLVTIGDADHSTRAWMNFMIVRSLSHYNGIIRRPGIREIQVVPSTAHEMLKFTIEGGIVTIRSTILIPAECTLVITSLAVSKEEGTRPVNFKVALHPDFPDQEVAIGGRLSAKGRTELCSILKKNLDIFAWQPSDMTGVPGIKASRGRDHERGLLSRLAVQSSHGKETRWQLADVRRFHGFEQGLSLAEPNEEKTAFHTGQGVYCYTKMPFDLKNAGATYQRLMDKAFDSQIGQNIEVYVNDLVFKSYTEAEMLRNVDETFRTLRKINMKLNPKKSKRLRRYFQAHTITVITDQPIKQIVSRPDVAGRLQKWSVMLGEHNITYRPRMSVKGQILADFLTEMPGENPPAAPVSETQQEPWILFTDGSSCVDGSGAGLILTSPEEIEFTYALRFQFAASNNQAEYEALIVGLWITADVCRQRGKHDQVPRQSQKLEKEVTTMVAKDGPTWMTPIMEYLKEGTLPDDRNEAEYVIKKIREGSCSIHAGPRSVVAKAIRLGYYWPTKYRDARDMIRKCNDCQIHRPVTRIPQQPLTPIMAPWPFYKWGIDIVGPFSERPGKVKFLIVAMDYFKKWIEAKAVATITGNQSNRLIERANRSLREGIKARLGEGNTNWVEELPYVLWAHRTMIKSSHGDTPFSLTYGTEAVIPAEIGRPTYYTAAVDFVYNDEELRLNLDLLEERRERAAIREAKAKLKMTKGPHENFQCQQMNQNFYEPNMCSNSISSDFDQFQPPQFPVIHQPPQEISIQEMEDLKQQYLNEMKRLINSKYRDEIKIDELKGNFNIMSIEINKKEKLQQLEHVANLSTYPSKRFNSFCYDDDDDEDYTVVITPDFLVTNYLIMENEHLDTIPETESDEFIKSSVENLVLIPSAEDFSDIESECDMPDCDDSQTTKFSTISNPPFNNSTSSDDESSHEEVIHEMSFKTYSNPLFDLDEEIIFSEFNPIHNEDLDSTSKNDRFDTKSYLLESLLNRDESIPSGIDSDDSDSEGDNLFLERLLHDDPIPLSNILAFSNVI
uniref:Reverse transcriptase domain-containing protein n=1 Tax=Tanacetum cinerariifolium TaxID=118510 RepID=A0A6L2P1R6_TANCI|nr:reverse transcriptase domain-containing protein [Tanacetum cinerariifolium]